jgi:TatA/E family protein of Tat protein translocase
LILLVVLLLFGAKKLPELSRSLGKSINEFKKGREEAADEAADEAAEKTDEPEQNG